MKNPDMYAFSEVGEGRSVNEDQFLVARLDRHLSILASSLPAEESDQLESEALGLLLLVADGVGGARGGDKASALAVDVLTDYVARTMPWFFQLQPTNESEIAEQLYTAIGQSELAVQRQGESEHQTGMGSTLTVAYVLWPDMYVVHVGDCRCYLLRKNSFMQLTTDHTVAEELRRQGALTKEQAENSPFENTVWNVVGGSKAGLSPEITKVRLQTGDVVVLCTDGIHAHVELSDYTSIFTSSNAQEACHALFEAVRTAGGRNNRTAVVSRF